MCWHCFSASLPPGPAGPRRRRLFGWAAAALAAPALAQVEVGPPSVARTLVPAATLEEAGSRQYGQLIAQARAQGRLAPDDDPALRRLRHMAARLVPHAVRFNARAAGWRWAIHLIRGPEVNAFCLPGGKIAFFTGILEKLGLSDAEQAMVLGHEMAHALREHARERLAKTAGTGAALSIAAQLFGLGQLGDLAARAGTQLLTLQFSRSDEIEADLVGLEIAARAGFEPRASVSLWRKMGALAADRGALGFLSTHPSGPDRIRRLEANLPKVEGLYRAAVRG